MERRELGSMKTRDIFGEIVYGFNTLKSTGECSMKALVKVDSNKIAAASANYNEVYEYYKKEVDKYAELAKKQIHKEGKGWRKEITVYDYLIGVGSCYYCDTEEGFILELEKYYNCDFKSVFLKSSKSLVVVINKIADLGVDSAYLEIDTALFVDNWYNKSQ